eukprot:gene32635-39457_t
MSFATVFSTDGSGSLLLELLCQWLNPYDVVQFDRVACNKFERRFLEGNYSKCTWYLDRIIKSYSLVSDELEVCRPDRFVSMAAWVQKRRITIVDDVTIWTVVNDEIMEVFEAEQVCVPFLKKMNLICGSALGSEESLRHLLTTFPSIERLAITFVNHDEDEDEDNKQLGKQLGKSLSTLASFWHLRDIACSWWPIAYKPKIRYSFLTGSCDSLEALRPAPDVTKQEFLYLVESFPGLKELRFPIEGHQIELHGGYSPSLDGFTLFLRDVSRLMELRALCVRAPLYWSRDDVETLVRPLNHLTHLEMYGSMEKKSEIPNFLRVLTHCKKIRYFSVNLHEYSLKEDAKGVVTGKLTLWDSMELGKDNLNTFVEVLNMLPCLNDLHLFPAEDIFNNSLLSRAIDRCRHKLSIQTLYMPFKAKLLRNAVSLLAALPALTALTVKFRSAVRPDWIVPFAEEVVRHCGRLRSLTLESIDDESCGVSPDVFRRLVLGLPHLTSLSLSSCKSPELTKECLLDVASTERVWELLYLPLSRHISFRGLCDAVALHGLRVKKVQVVTERPSSKLRQRDAKYCDYTPRSAREKIWLELMGSAASEGTSFIFTFNPENSVSPDFIPNLEETLKAHDATVIYVQVTCTDEALEDRMNSESRQRFKKLTSFAFFQELKAKGAFDFPALPCDLLIDSSAMSPDDAATKIFECLKV